MYGSRRDYPIGPAHAGNGAGGAARETEWGGADLPRVRVDGAKQGAESGRDVRSRRPVARRSVISTLYTCLKDQDLYFFFSK